MRVLPTRRTVPAGSRQLCLILAALVWGCAAEPPGQGPTGDDAGARERAQPAGAPPSLAQLSQATFTGVYEEPIRLEDGRYEGPPFREGSASRPTLKLVTELHAAGDLDGDGHPEAAVLLVERSGGSGSFLYVAAVGMSQGVPVNLGTRLVGDRVQARAISVANGKINLDLVVHAGNDAMCCPTRLVRRAWSWLDGSLEEGAAVEQGPLDLGAIAGVTWRLDGGLGAARVRAAALTARFDEGRIAGASGCNEYSGAVEDQGPGVLRIGPVLTTRRACETPIMDLEAAFLSVLQGATRYGFDMGRLTLSGSPDSASASALVFARESRVNR